MFIKFRVKLFIKYFLIVESLFAYLCATQDHSEKRCLQYKRLLYENNVSFSYFLAGAEQHSITEDRCRSLFPLVVGGENALPKEFPFAALLGSLETIGNNINWFCGGTIISQYYVMTAAHCFYSPLGIINRVRLGELDFHSYSDDADPENFFVQKLIEHPDYRHNEPYNDIGLILLTKAITFNSYKHPACLPSPYINEEQFNSLIAIGWGHTQFAGQSSSRLQKVKLQPYPYENCASLAASNEGLDILPSGLRPSILCAGSTEIKDTCQGDSGGPLVVQHPQFPCMKIVVGITSTGFSGCATPNIPSLYTRVKSYLGWIYTYIT
ncbi:serine protease snk-like [Haematobia irritans]|uniref:serine protease snk-like n=1 Tax=Haematobia irritans TaxID=7368 RepID=UPI003F4FD0D3